MKHIVAEGQRVTNQSPFWHSGVENKPFWSISRHVYLPVSPDYLANLPLLIEIIRITDILKLKLVGALWCYPT